MPTFNTNKQNLYIEMESFYRLAKLKTHFKDQYNDELNMEDQIFKHQSNKKWTPNKNHYIMKRYIEAPETELIQPGGISDNKRNNKLYKDERIALKELSDCTDIIITKADKGAAVVIMDVKYYINEVHHQLKNKDHYEKLNKDARTTNAKLGNDTIQRFKKDKLLKEKDESV